MTTILFLVAVFGNSRGTGDLLLGDLELHGRDDLSICGLGWMHARVFLVFGFFVDKFLGAFGDFAPCHDFRLLFDLRGEKEFEGKVL